MNATAFDYGYVGEKATSTRTLKNVGDQGGGDQGGADAQPVDTSKMTGDQQAVVAQQQHDLAVQQMQYQNLRNRYAIGYDEQSSVEPDVRVTSQVSLQQQGDIQAAGEIMGEVDVNFKSDVFPLEKLVNTDQLLNLNKAQGAGPGAPPPPAPGAQPGASASGTPATPPPASTPAATAAPASK